MTELLLQSLLPSGGRLRHRHSWPRAYSVCSVNAVVQSGSLFLSNLRPIGGAWRAETHPGFSFNKNYFWFSSFYPSPHSLYKITIYGPWPPPPNSKSLFNTHTLLPLPLIIIKQHSFSRSVPGVGLMAAAPSCTRQSNCLQDNYQNSLWHFQIKVKISFINLIRNNITFKHKRISLI